MKNSGVIILSLLGLFLNSCSPVAITTSPENPPAAASKTIYDPLLAQQLGADEYGMKKYVMAFLKRGPNRNQDEATAQALQKAHLENINRLASEGKLVIAGPFMDDGAIRGIYIFNVTSIEEATKLTETDPAIKAGRLVMELHPWYGSAALMQVNATHKKLEKKNVAEN